MLYYKAFAILLLIVNPDGLILWLSDPFANNEELETEFALSLAEYGYPVAVTTIAHFTNQSSFDIALEENPESFVDAINNVLASVVDNLPFLVTKVCLAGVGRSGSVSLLITRESFKDFVGIIAISPTSLKTTTDFNFDGFVAIYHGDANEDVSSTDLFAFEDVLRQANVIYEVTRYSMTRQSILTDVVSWTRTRASIKTFLDVVFRPEDLEYITTPVFSTNIDASSFHSEFVEYTNGGESFRGYIAYPNRQNAPLPVVVIAPDWDGVSEYEIWRAKLLAQMGYVAFVADIYGATVEQGPSLTFARRVELSRTYSGRAFIPRALAAINAVIATEKVDADEGNVALIGYCFGGSGVLQVARTEVPGLKGVAAFHPGMLTISNVTELSCYKTATLILNGADDTSNDRIEINQFRDEFNMKESIWEFTNYGLARHSFTEPQVPRNGNFAAYSPYADVRSFASLVNFLTEIFTPVEDNVYKHCT
eukprot:g3234.t1